MNIHVFCYSETQSMQNCTLSGQVDNIQSSYLTTKYFGNKNVVNDVQENKLNIDR